MFYVRTAGLYVIISIHMKPRSFVFVIFQTKTYYTKKVIQHIPNVLDNLFLFQ